MDYSGCGGGDRGCPKDSQGSRLSYCGACRYRQITVNGRGTYIKGCRTTIDRYIRIGSGVIIRRNRYRTGKRIRCRIECDGCIVSTRCERRSTGNR